MEKPSPPHPLTKRGGGVETTGVAREAASLREAPPSRSLPKSGGRLSRLLLHSWFRLSVGCVSDGLGGGHGG